MSNTASPAESKKRAKNEEERTPLSTLFMNLVWAMDDDVRSAMPKFPRKFHLVEPNPGKYLVLREQENRVAVTTTLADVSATILRYAQQDLDHPEWNSWIAKTAELAAKFWLDMSAGKPLPMPRSWAWADDPDLCFHRLPWTKKDTGAHPTWDALLKNMDNAKAFKAWIGSLFVPESDRQTYVWLYGAGQDGKGSVVRFLRRVFGSACGAEDATKAHGNFWTSGIIGKRLIMFTDTNSAAFPASGLLKALTGGDPVRVEIKGGAIFTAELECKLLFASNHRPEISSGKADMRRPIFCEMKTVPDHLVDTSFEKSLWAEGGAFINSAIAEYLADYPTHRPIRPETGKLEDWVEDLEAHLAALYHAEFRTTPLPESCECRAAGPRGEIIHKCDWELQPNQLARWLMRQVRDHRDQKKFRDYLAKKGHVKRNIRYVCETTGKALIRKRYSGICLIDHTNFSAAGDVNADSEGS